ncbi:MAG: ADP-glyceromanno-heptose 6-epimerase [Acidobacteria bacterium]|nr:ADP-glyceromanno-heptose 6-epimerase [Acidobacteriota bacterium]
MTTSPSLQTASATPVLLTGAAGFIGSRCFEALTAAGQAALAVDTRAHFAARTEHAFVAPPLIIDVNDLAVWLETAPAVRAVVHLGACTDTRETDRAYLTRRNFEASKHLWHWSRERDIPFVYASSAATYGDGRYGYDDDESLIPKLVPLNAYGDSKQQFDVWALDQERRGQAPTNWCGLKFFNVYGFGERHKGPMSSVVLQAFDQIRATGRLRLFRSHRDGIADGHQSRDFVFVDDVVDTLLALVERPPARGIFNLGSGRARTFLDLGRATFAAMGRPEQIDFIDTPPDIRAHYQYFTQATMMRLAAAGYVRRTTSLEDGVHQYVAALEAHQVR